MARSPITWLLRAHFGIADRKSGADPTNGLPCCPVRSDGQGWASNGLCNQCLRELTFRTGLTSLPSLIPCRMRARLAIPHDFLNIFFPLKWSLDRRTRRFCQTPFP